MLINKATKQFMSRSDKPNENWLNDDNYIVVEDESELYYKIINSEGNFELKIEDGKLVDIVFPRADEILAELAELDNTINRATEDLYTLTNTTPYQKTAEVIARKEELRQELKELEVEENGEGTEPTGSKWSN